jgi:hypothetical protein
MSYVGMAANVVGGELQGWASVLDKQNMYDAYKKQLGTQAGYRDQALGQFGSNVNQFGSDQAERSLSTGTAARTNAYNQEAKVPLGFKAPYQQSSSDGRDQMFLADRGAARAALGAYGDWALSNTLNDIQNKESLRRIIDAAKGESKVYQYDAYKAQHSNDDLAMIGAAISSIGGGSVNFSQYNQQPQQAGSGAWPKTNPGPAMDQQILQDNQWGSQLG